ncbi:hypothetical protein HYQ46_009209 [Verticillium longisporum]|nr:hypothetical protein HYQ46_009209 [Verticillium longisporum]
MLTHAAHGATEHDGPAAVEAVLAGRSGAAHDVAAEAVDALGHAAAVGSSPGRRLHGAREAVAAILDVERREG